MGASGSAAASAPAAPAEDDGASGSRPAGPAEPAEPAQPAKRARRAAAAAGGECGECGVCCSAFSAVLRRPVGCGYCGFSSCRACVQRYLLSQPSDAKCMGCGAAWSREFLDSQLPRSWLAGAYRKHREKVLLDRERALLPASQILVENHRAATALETTIAEQRAEATALKRRLDHLSRLVYTGKIRLAQLRRRGGDGGGGGGERREFVRGCPVDGCRGFLSTAWKCGTCGARACPTCHDVVAPPTAAAAAGAAAGAAAEEALAPPAAAHVCDPSSVASAALIRRDSRPCPRCASMIHRVSGCDQMWCTRCQTAFSWRTGAVVTSGVIHNPHYTAWIQRRRAGGAGDAGGGDGGGEGDAAGAAFVPRAPGDVPCGGVPSLWDLDRTLRRVGTPQATRRAVGEFHRVTRHIQDQTLPPLATAFTIADNADLRVRYLMGEATEAELSSALQRREKRRDKELSLRQIYEMFVNASAETFTKILREEATATQALDELHALLGFANDSLAATAARFGVKPHHIQVWARTA